MNTPLPLVSGSSQPSITDPADTQVPTPIRRIVPPFQNDGAMVTMRLFGRSDQNLLTFGRAHFSAMEDNAYFLEPSPSQAKFGTMLEAFADDCAEVMALKTALATAVAHKNARREALIRQLDQRGSYVQGMSRGKQGGHHLQRPGRAA